MAIEREKIVAEMSGHVDTMMNTAAEIYKNYIANLDDTKLENFSKAFTQEVRDTLIKHLTDTLSKGK